MGVRLSALLPTKQQLEIKYPDANGVPTGLVLTVVGQESYEYIEAINKWIDARAQDPEKKPTSKEAWAALADQTAAHIVGWTGLLDDNDRPIEYSPEKAAELIGNPGMFHVRSQVEEFVKQRTNFFRPLPSAAGAGGEAGGKA